MQVLFAHLVYSDCTKIRWLFWFPTYVRDDLNGLKWTGFLAESHINHLWNSSCGSNFMCSKKVRNISRFDWDRQSRMRDYHLSLHSPGKVKTNWPYMCFSNRRNYCPDNKDRIQPKLISINIYSKNIIVWRSDWPRAKWDQAYCKRTTGHFMTNPGALD